MLAGFLQSGNLAEVIHGLTEVHLVPLSPEDPGIRLAPGAATAFRELQELARRDGLNLRAASGFRSFERQLRIFSGKMDGSRPVLDRNEQPLDIRGMDPEQLIRAILVFSAVPGLSRHHFGTDIDVYDPDLVPEGGDRGGYLVASGTPEELTHVQGSYTGEYLAKVLRKKAIKK